MADVTNRGSSGVSGAAPGQPPRRSRAPLDRRSVLTPAGDRINVYLDTEVELVDTEGYVGVVADSATGGRKKWILCDNLAQARRVRDTLAAFAEDLDDAPDPDWTGLAALRDEAAN